MKISITADLHYGITDVSEIRSMAKRMSAESPDVVVLAGDLAETVLDPGRFSDLLIIFRMEIPGTPILVVIGNHDLWCSKRANYDSKDLWTRQLPNMTKASQCFWLEGENWSRDGVAIVGSYLHYDYSAQDKVGWSSTLPHEYLAKNKRKVNADCKYMRGLPDDITFAREIGEGFRQRLLEAQDDPSIESIVVATHVPCVEQLISREPHNPEWSIATSYFGNLSHQDVIFGCDKVRWVVSAHSHKEISAAFDSPKGKVQLFNLGSHYHKPEYKTIEV